MEWSGLGFETATVGYNSNGDYYDNNPANGLPDIAQIISCDIPEGVRRKRQTGPNGGDTMQLRSNNTSILCMDLSRADNGFIPDIHQFNETLPKCPPTKAQLNICNDFQEFPPQQDDCYRTKMVAEVDIINQTTVPFVYVCCYATNG